MRKADKQQKPHRSQMTFTSKEMPSEPARPDICSTLILKRLSRLKRPKTQTKQLIMRFTVQVVQVAVLFQFVLQTLGDTILMQATLTGQEMLGIKQKAEAWLDMCFSLSLFFLKLQTVRKAQNKWFLCGTWVQLLCLTGLSTMVGLQTHQQRWDQPHAKPHAAMKIESIRISIMQLLICTPSSHLTIDSGSMVYVNVWQTRVGKFWCLAASGLQFQQLLHHRNMSSGCRPMQRTCTS